MTRSRKSAGPMDGYDLAVVDVMDIGLCQKAQHSQWWSPGLVKSYAALLERDYNGL